MTTRVNRYQNVFILDFIGPKDDGSFLQAECCSCRPNKSLKALMEKGKVGHDRGLIITKQMKCTMSHPIKIQGEPKIPTLLAHRFPVRLLHQLIVKVNTRHHVCCNK